MDSGCLAEGVGGVFVQNLTPRSITQQNRSTRSTMTRTLFLICSFILLGFTSCNSPQTDANAKQNDSKTEVNESAITKLAIKQLEAYNRADLDGFCACYHPDVRVFSGETEKPPGIDAFRERYVKMFAKGGFGASVPTRVSHGDHCVDLEHWWRDEGKTGEVLVRYTEKDGLIGVVQFLR